MVSSAGEGSPPLWVCHRLRGREKLEQSKASWRLGLGNLLNGPICPLCLPNCLDAESGEDDSRRSSCFPSLLLPLTNCWSKPTSSPSLHSEQFLEGRRLEPCSTEMLFPLHITLGTWPWGLCEYFLTSRACPSTLCALHGMERGSGFSPSFP